MSEQMVLDFLEATQNDATLLDRVKTASSMAGILEVADAAGFAFTEAEVSSLGNVLAESARGVSKGELSDSEMDLVSGGVNINNNYYPADAMVTINSSHREIFGSFLPAASVNNLW